MLNSAVILLILFNFNCIDGKVHVANVLLPSSPTDLNASMVMQKVVANISYDLLPTQTRGQCSSILSESDCRALSREYSEVTGFHEYVKGAGAPKGCYIWTVANHNKNKIFYNPNGQSACTASRACICKFSELWRSYKNGPGCNGATIATAVQCGGAAASLGYSRSVTSGSWGHAPLGCFIGHGVTYFNSQAGQTGRPIYRSVCLATAPAFVMLPNGPGCYGPPIETAVQCGGALASLGYKKSVVSGSWGHAPLGCFFGHGDTYFNSQAGQTGRPIYTSVCLVGPWDVSIRIRVDYTSEAQDYASQYNHTYVRTSSFKDTYSSTSGEIHVQAISQNYAGTASGALAIIDQDIQHDENEKNTLTGSTIRYQRGTFQIWRTEEIIMILNHQRITDIRKTWTESPRQNMGSDERLALAKKYLKNYYDTDGLKPTYNFRFSSTN